MYGLFDPGDRNPLMCMDFSIPGIESLSRVGTFRSLGSDQCTLSLACAETEWIFDPGDRFSKNFFET